MTEFRKKCWLAGIFLFFVFGWGQLCAQDWVAVRWVADGDTIVLADGRHVRYIGIDTPEVAHENRRAEPFGEAAKAFNRELVMGKRIRLETDREKMDRYGRLLAYVYREDGLFVNTELLRRGLAYVLYHFPNHAKVGELLAVQREAMGQGRGIWQRVSKDERPDHAYLGNRRSKRFHVYDCPQGNRMSANNRIRFENQWAAFWEGYAPAKGCIVFPPE
ncbi:thermonuclease family protein [uncultured Desulfosarcina sp.]|uniref:thermonuclease family protein n=1 Tax=uncultured Desulfosarcina sp. TaxID=218289 RepID=UPI0029C678DB|nr:thermonuclease family protein [uncultured Desulfosarcina sp.]